MANRPRWARPLTWTDCASESTLPEDIAIPADLLPGLRSAWFKHVLLNDDELLGFLNSFRIDWLHQCLEAMLLTTAVRDQSTLAEAYASIHDSFDDKLDETLDAMFRSLQRDRVRVRGAVTNGRSAQGSTQEPSHRGPSRCLGAAVLVS